jgi:hypothetical protein
MLSFTVAPAEMKAMLGESGGGRRPEGLGANVAQTVSLLHKRQPLGRQALAQSLGNDQYTQTDSLRYKAIRRSSLESISDPAAGQIIRRHLDADAVAHQNAYAVFAHFAGNSRQYDVRTIV